MESLITENLILRKAKLTDLELIWKNVWSDEQIAENMLWKVTKTREEAVERLNRTIKYQADNYAYFVCLKLKTYFHDTNIYVFLQIANNFLCCKKEWYMN